MESSWQNLLLLTACACALGLVLGQAVPAPCANVNAGTVSPKIPLPDLPVTAFKTDIRAVIVNKNQTVEAKEYVDESQNMAALKLNQAGVQYTILMSYTTNEVIYMNPPQAGDPVASVLSCAVTNLTFDDNTQLFGFTNGGSAPGHLFSTSHILNFINGTEVYKGQTNISGIPVNHWTSCVYWTETNSNFTLDYYFTAPGWQTPSGLDQVPMQAEVQGITSYPNGTVTTFHHVYTYVNFQAYVDDSENVFTTPAGVFCLNRASQKPLPTINNHFFYREEITSNSQGGQTVTETDIYYDYNMQLVRYDQRFIPDGSSNMFPGSSGPFTVIHDYGTGIQYTIARDLGTCSIDPIPASAQGFDAVHNITRDTYKMRSPTQFFYLDQGQYIYAGQRTARGMPCDVFQTFLTNMPGYSIVIYEIYFLAGGTNIVDKGSDASNTTFQAVPFRILMWANSNLVAEYEIHDFDQYALQSTSFDISPCFTGSATKDFEITLRGANQFPNLMTQLSPAIYGMMALEVAVNTAVTSIRIQNMRLHWDSLNVYFQGTLVDAPPSIAKYEPKVGQFMAQGQGKAISNIGSPQDCATQCDLLQEWNCVSFDYCATGNVCSLSKLSTVPALINSTQCTHYQRVLGSYSVAGANLTTVWTSLKNAVFLNNVKFDIPLPDANGNIDLTQDTTKMDATQKLSLVAFDITDQVVSNPNRNGFGSSDLDQFTVIQNKMGKSYVSVVRGVAVDDCAGQCVHEQTFNCQSFHYCWDAGSCFLSTLHPDDSPDRLRDTAACDLYARDYSSNYDQYPGISVVSASTIIYQNVRSASQCAKLCSTYTPFHCESFDFCPDISACYLGQTHYYDAPKANIQTAPSCGHFSRNYLSDFVQKQQKVVAFTNNRVITLVSAAQCAKLCVEESSFNCMSFDFCANFTECRLSDVTVANTGVTTIDQSAFCDVYFRQYASGSAGAVALQVQASASGSGLFTPGSAAALAIGMCVLGALVGLLGLFFYTKKFTGSLGVDGMAISFSKQENAE